MRFIFFKKRRLPKYRDFPVSQDKRMASFPYAILSASLLYEKKYRSCPIIPFYNEDTKFSSDVVRKKSAPC